jgi:hypothetical protein
MTPQEECELVRSYEGEFEENVFYTTGCWWWGGSFVRFGYGSLLMGEKRVAAHRASWMIHFGAIPTGILVCHKCDNPCCVNPDHLFLGTHTDNCRDKLQKGRARARRGEQSVKAKLNNASVREIRARHAAGETYKALAAAYGVSYSTIEKISTREHWKHID